MSGYVFCRHCRALFIGLRSAKFIHMCPGDGNWITSPTKRRTHTVTMARRTFYNGDGSREDLRLAARVLEKASIKPLGSE